MIKKKPFTFQVSSQGGWQNIALLTLVVFYIAQYSMDLFVWKVMCVHVAQDYCGYWSAAKIANETGYAESFDGDRLAEIQRTILPANTPLFVHGSPYLPIFLLPFQLLVFLGPNAGYWVWTILSLLLVIFYLRYFAKSTTKQALDTRLLFMVLLSAPFFLNIFLGQVNLWLTVCIGEHLRATTSGKQFAAGVWLAGLLLKPQYLVIIGLILLIHRYGKMLAGLIVSSVTILGITFVMTGVDGFQAMMRTWLGLGTSNQDSVAGVMMNWRMVGVDLANHLGLGIAWGIAGLGAIATIALTLYIWKRPIKSDTNSYVIALIGALAATTALAWHSNPASAVILIAPLIYLSQKPAILPGRFLSIWVFTPPAVYFIVFVLAIFYQTGRLPANWGDLLDFMNAAVQLVVNMVLLVWAAIQFRGKQTSMVTVQQDPGIS